MRIEVDISALRRNTWYEYLVRFAAGGAVSVVAGLIAKKYGPGIGGLFLAFPAIFPATATLLASHEKRKRRQSGEQRGRKLAATDACGATFGGVGLIAFAAVVMLLISEQSILLTLIAATAAWAAVSMSLWIAREYPWKWIRRRLYKSRKPYTEPNDFHLHRHRRSS